LIRQDGPSELAVALGAIAAGGLLPNRNPEPWDAYKGMRLWGTAEHIVAWGTDEDVEPVRVSVLSDGNYTVDGLSLSIALSSNGWRVTTDGYQQNVQTVVTPNSVSVFSNGQCDTFKISDPLAQDDAQAGGGDFVIAPMPGLVAQVLVATGDTLTAGQDLMILEAMKMEHRLSAQRDGVVAEVLVSAGEQVSDGVLLLQLEPEGD
jgi:3-methylcrotonyl-CoA carboxylase alpha subunit